MKMRRMTALFLSLLLCVCMAGTRASAAQQTATVQGGWLVMRDAPSFSGNIIASYPSGTVVTVTGQNGSWYAVQDSKGRTGYMLGNYLILSGTGTSEDAEGEFRYSAYVTSANGLNVRLRSGPGLGYSILASYPPGTPCTVLSTGTNWSKIQIGIHIGYMMNQFLTTHHESGSGSYQPVTPVTPTMSPGSGYTVYVTSRNGFGVNLRSGPGKNYPSIGFYSVGTSAEMISAGSIWSYIRIGSRYGYMMSEFLTTTYVPPVTPVYTGSAYVISYNGRNVNLRSGPGKGYSTIRSFPVGTPLTVIVRGSEWYYIQINGYYGYMMRQFIADIQQPTTQYQPVYPESTFQTTPISETQYQPTYRGNE